MLSQQKLTEFLDSLAARTPTPGGGSAGALAGAMGTALALMVLRFSKLEESAPFERKLEEIRDKLTRLIDEDAKAYDKVSNAFKLPKSNDAEKLARSQAIQEATRFAAQTPLGGMELVHEGLTVTKAFAPECNKNLVSDLASAVILLHSASLMMGHNVTINVKSLKEPGPLAQDAARLQSDIDRLRSDIERIYEA
jgi:glutamate formiminotransferase/formiminotetrahydrofolate cyclodeaminase